MKREGKAYRGSRLLDAGGATDERTREHEPARALRKRVAQIGSNGESYWEHEVLFWEAALLAEHDHVQVNGGEDACYPGEQRPHEGAGQAVEDESGHRGVQEIHGVKRKLAAGAAVAGEPAGLPGIGEGSEHEGVEGVLGGRLGLPEIAVQPLAAQEELARIVEEALVFAHRQEELGELEGEGREEDAQRNKH